MDIFKKYTLNIQKWCLFGIRTLLDKSKSIKVSSFKYESKIEERQE